MTLALIAGTGDLPKHVAAACDAPPFVASVEGFLPNDLTPDIRFRFETLGTFLASLAKHGISRLCLVGGIERPQIDPSRIDAATAPLLSRINEAMVQGDDAALRAVMAIFSEAGFDIVSAAEIAPALLAQPGVLGDAQPRPHHAADAERGMRIIAAMGAVDVGQACVVAKGQALAIEALPGTDWMLRSLTVPVPQPLGETGTFVDDLLGGAADWLSASPAASPATRHRDPALPPGGVLVKAPKPTQSLLADMPTIGPDTVTAAAAAGLDGIVIAAGQVIVLNQKELLDRANAAGLFVWAREGQG